MSINNAVSHESNRFYIDTTGMWMLEAFFNETLEKLENRHYEYLAYLINAFSNPDSIFIGVMPTEKRRNKFLPPFYDLLDKKGLLRNEVFIGADNLIETSDVLEKQFETFCNHLQFYPEDIIKFASFHTSSSIAKGFYYATERNEKIPGVPDFISDFLTKDRKLYLCSIARSGDIDQLQRAFAIYQRGYKYAAHAAYNNAYYLTHPIRWSASGTASKVQELSDVSCIIGGIAAASIQSKSIKGPEDLFKRLTIVREGQPKWKEKIAKIENKIINANNENQLKQLEAELIKEVVIEIAPWVKMEMSSYLHVAIIDFVALICGSLVGKYIGNAPLSIPLIAGGIGLSIKILSTPIKVKPGFKESLRRSTNFRLEKYIPQSCEICGAPLRISVSSNRCVVCKNKLHDN